MPHYLYLTYSLIFLAILGGALWFRKDLWHTAWPCMLFGAIAGPVSELIYFRDYWRPTTILGLRYFSIEDVLCGMAIYGIAAISYPFFMRKRVAHTQASFPKVRSITPVILTTAVLIIIFNFLFGINSIVATMLGTSIIWVRFARKHPTLIKPTLLSGIICSLGVLFGYSIGLDLIDPQALSKLWLLHGGLLGTTIFGHIPLTEIVWFGAMGLYVPMVYMHSTQARYEPLAIVSSEEADEAGQP